jgi:hypothetical protein
VMIYFAKVSHVEPVFVEGLGDALRVGEVG